MTGQAAGHELLLRLAGRLPDALTWRLRDWLADGAVEVLAHTVARELLRHRVGLTDAERDLLRATVGGEHGPGQARVVEAVLPVPDVAEPVPVFVPRDEAPDAAALSVLAVVRAHSGAVTLREAWRAGDVPGVRQRVVVVHGGQEPWVLAGTVGRVLRAHGDRTPCVEVLPPHGDPSPYHEAAIIGSAVLWTGALVGA